MNTQATDGEVFRAVLGELAWERAGEHPDHDALAGYLTGELEAEASARINDHLVACRSCAATLLDMEPLAEPDAGMPEGVADLAAAAAWRDLRHRVFDEVPARPAVSRQWWSAVAASLLVATLGLSLWVLQLQGVTTEQRQQLADRSGPQPNMPLTYFGDSPRSFDGETVEVPTGDGFYGLIFRLAELEMYDYEEYEVRFVDASDTELPPIGGLELSSQGGLRLGLPRDFLPEGEYRVRLSGLDDGQWRALEEHRIRIVRQGGP